MEENTAIQLLQMDGKVLVDSRIVAKNIGIRHKNLMETIYTYQSELEEFGILPFQTEEIKGRGQPEKYVLLNRNQAGVVISFSRNTPQVVRFKVDLFKAIDVMEKELAGTKERLAIALAVVEKMETVLDAIHRGDADFVASFNAAGMLDLPMLNMLNDMLDTFAEQQQAKLQPKPLDHPLSEESKEVLAVLDQAGCPVTLKELATILGKDEITVLKTVFGMLCREEIKRVDDAYVSLVLPGN